MPVPEACAEPACRSKTDLLRVLRQGAKAPAAEPSDADLCREIGLDPARLTARDGVVWVSPHVHAATDDMVERDAIRAMNRSPCLAAAAAGADGELRFARPGQGGRGARSHPSRAGRVQGSAAGAH